MSDTQDCQHIPQKCVHYNPIAQLKRLSTNPSSYTFRLCFHLWPHNSQMRTPQITEELCTTHIPVKGRVTLALQISSSIQLIRNILPVLLHSTWLSWPILAAWERVNRIVQQDPNECCW